MFAYWASINWTYVMVIALCLIMFVVFAVLFAIAERWGGGSSAKKKEKPKEDKKPEEVKIVIEEHTKVTREEKEVEKVARDKELNRNNLADDITILVENENKSLDRQDRAGDRVFKSRLSNTGRMRQYYEKRHNARGQANAANTYSYELLSPTSPTGNDEYDYEGIRLTAEDMKRLQLLKDVFDRKSSTPENW